MTRIALILVAALAIALGIGEPVAAEPGSEGPPTGVIAFVEGAPPSLGIVTPAEFHRSLAQVAAQAGISPAPKLGDRRYRRFAEQALDDLLDFAWIQGEAAALGLIVTQRQISRRFAAIKKENFESEADYRKFLREAKLTEAEARERVRIQILSTRIQATVVQGTRSSKEAQQALTEFVEDYSRRWKSRTICAERYATDHCGNGPPS